MSTRGTGLLGTVALLGLLDTALLIVDVARPPATLPPAAGGVGLGPALSPSWSFHAFDPRLSATCENELWPIPGLTCPNPVHGCRGPMFDGGP